MEGCCPFLEEDEVKPGCQKQVAIAERIALPGVLSLLVEYPSAEAVAVDAEAVGGGVEGGLARGHFEDRLRDVLHPQYLYLIIAALSDCLEVVFHQLVEHARLALAHPQNQGLNLIVSHHWRRQYDRRDR